MVGDLLHIFNIPIYQLSADSDLSYSPGKCAVFFEEVMEFNIIKNIDAIIISPNTTEMFHPDLGIFSQYQDDAFYFSDKILDDDHFIELLIYQTAIYLRGKYELLLDEQTYILERDQKFSDGIKTEYFVLGFEEYFIGDRAKLKENNPILHLKIEEILKIEIENY